jgi:hypothetical protein
MKRPPGGDVHRLAGLQVADARAGELPLVVAEVALDRAVEQPRDLRVRARAVLHDLRCAQLLAAVDDRHAVRELGEEVRLLHRGVAAAHHQDVLPLVEEPVAGGAGRDAAHGRAEVELVLEAQPLGARAGRDHQRVGGHGALRELQAEGPVGQVGGAQRALGEGRAEALGLSPEAVHQRGTHDALGEPRVVVDVGRQHELPAGQVGLVAAAAALDHQRLQVRARGVDRRREARGSGTEDDDPVSSLRDMPRQYNWHRRTPRARREIMAARCPKPL